VTKLVLCGLRRQIAKNTSSTGNYSISSGPVSRLDRAVLSNRVAVSLSVTNLRGRSPSSTLGILSDRYLDIPLLGNIDAFGVIFVLEPET
jgi:hypothetical protein